MNHIKSTVLRVGLSLAVSGLLLAMLLHFWTDGVGPGEKPTVLRLIIQTPLLAVAAYVFLMLLQTGLRAVRFRLLLMASPQPEVPSFSRTMMVTLVRGMFVDLLPARLGELTYVALMRLGCGVASAHGTSSLLISFIFDIIALFGLLGGVWVLALFDTQLTPRLLPVIAVLALLVPVMLWTTFKGIDLIARFSQRLPAGIKKRKRIAQIVAFVKDTADSVASAKSAGVIGRLLLLSLAIRTLKYASLICLFYGVVSGGLSLGADLPLAHLLTALVSAEAAASLPIPAFMGFGTYEAGGALALTAFGLTKAMSVMVMLVIHILSQLADYSFGGLALIGFFWIVRTKKRPDPASPRSGAGRWALATAALLVVCALLALGWQYRQFSKTGAMQPPDPGQAQQSLLHAGAEALPQAIMVWSSNRAGNHDIWQMTLPDRQTKPLTRHPHTEYYPRLSPDGRMLAFCRSREPWVPQRNYFAWDVILLNLATGEERKLADGGNFPTWSQDGTKIYYMRGRYRLQGSSNRLQLMGTQVIVHTLSTGQEAVIYETGGEGQLHYSVWLVHPAVDPQRPRLAASFVHGIRAAAIYHPDGRWEKIGGGCQPTWGPQGNYLTYIDKGGRQENAIYYVDGATLERRVWLDLPGEFSHEYFPKVSPDGRYLVFGASRGDHQHDAADYEIFLWKIGANPDQAQRLTFHTGNDNWPDIRILSQEKA